MIDLDRIEHAHLLGIGGIGVSAVARLLLQAGIRVSGCDVKESSLTRALAAEGAEVQIGHDAAHLEGGPKLLVHSTAVPEDNPERAAAVAGGIPCAHRADLLAAFVRRQPSIGVTGTHGKGTVAAMVTRILDAAGLEPGFCIGGLLLDYQTNARLGGGRVLVAEVDESDGSQLRVHPNHCVVTYLELDHLNYYAGLDDIVETAARFLAGNDRLESVCVNVGCAGVRRLLERLDRPVTTYALGEDADLSGRVVEAAPRSVSLDVFRRGHGLGRVRLPIPGEHNAENALAAIGVATTAFDVPFSTAADALADFHGLENRFTIVEAGGVMVVKDYLSHPTGMRKVLRAARRLADGRLFAVYKPYRFTLLRYLGDEYAEAFSAADHVILTDMYTAGEAPIDGIGSDYLVRRCRDRGLPVTHVPGTDDIPAALDGQLEPGDVVALFGGDDFFEMADAWSLTRQPG